MNNSETQRLLNNILKIVKVTQVDYAKAKVKVTDGAGFNSDWIAIMTTRASKKNTISWSPPDVDEQGILLSPSGDLAGGVFLAGLYSAENEQKQVKKEIDEIDFAGSFVRRNKKDLEINFLGDVIIKATGKIKIQSGAKMEVISGAKMDITAADNLTQKASKIDLN